MENYYETLGLKTSASTDEIRRAYRILARRYHPDLNPGQTGAEDKFKKISNAYAVLSDSQRKQQYDTELERFLNNTAQKAHRAYKRAEDNFRRANERLRKMSSRPAFEDPSSNQRRRGSSITDYGYPMGVESILKPFSTLKNYFIKDKQKGKKSRTQDRKVSVIEVSIALREAITGIKKTIELAEPEGARKISVSIPPGVRNGSVIHLRSKPPHTEELVIIIRLPHHPSLSIQTRGLVFEVPITVGEAIQGASITIPTLEEPVSLRIPPGSQSGNEIRVAERGLFLKEGGRGDLFVKLLIQVPGSHEAIGLQDQAKTLEQYYAHPVRDNLPKNLIQLCDR